MCNISVKFIRQLLIVSEIDSLSERGSKLSLVPGGSTVPL